MSKSNETKVVGKHGWDDMMKSFAQVCWIKINSKKHTCLLFVELGDENMKKC